MKRPVTARLRANVAAWFDAHAATPGVPADDRIDPIRLLPFIAIHLGCLAVWWVGVSTTAVVVAGGAVCAAHVRDHGVLPPLLRAQRVPHWPRGAVRVRAARRVGGAARPAVVGLAPPAPPRARRRARRQPLGAAPRSVVEPCGLVHVARQLRAARRAGDLAGPLSRAALPRPLGRADAAAAVRGAVRRWRGGRRACAEPGYQRRRSCWCGASASRRWRCTTPPSASTRWRTAYGTRRVRHARRVAQQRVAGAAHLRRRLAQQPPPLPGGGAPGLLLVGDRHHLLRPETAAAPAHRVGRARGAGRGARCACRQCRRPAREDRGRRHRHRRQRGGAPAARCARPHRVRGRRARRRPHAHAPHRTGRRDAARRHRLHRLQPTAPTRTSSSCWPTWAWPRTTAR